MRIGIIGDIHFSEYSSILRSRGEKYSLRLENCIESINWAENAIRTCDLVIYLGDFFDKSSLNAEELTALTDLTFDLDIPHRFLVGNHEMGINSLVYSSAHIFDTLERASIIDKPTQVDFPEENVTLCYLPYILESERQPLESYFPNSKQEHVIIFSHNDIAGIQMGPVVSKAGFSIEEIEANCDYFFNGHLHNGMPVTNKIINVGNLTGQNFSEDGFKYSHNIFIFDTNTMGYEVKRNPFAINFYKLDNLSDIDRVINGVITLKVNQDNVEQAKSSLALNNEILASRLIIDYNTATDNKDNDIKQLSVNHLDEFRTFALQELSGSFDANLLTEELSYIHG